MAKLSEERGDLVGAMIVGADDEVLVVMEGGKVVRSLVAEVPAKGRDTMGVVFAKPDAGDRIIAVARNSERVVVAEVEADAEAEPGTEPVAEQVGDTDAVVDQTAEAGADRSDESTEQE